MTIVFKSGKTLKVDADSVKNIKDNMPQSGTQHFFWLNDTNGNPVLMVNVFDISHIKP